MMAASGGQPRGVEGVEAFLDGIGEEGKGKRTAQYSSDSPPVLLIKEGKKLR